MLLNNKNQTFYIKDSEKFVIRNTQQFDILANAYPANNISWDNRHQSR